MDKFIEILLMFLIIYCPLAFGAVHIFSFTLMEIWVLLLVLGWFLIRIFNSRQLAMGGVGEHWVRYGLSFEKMPLNYSGLLLVGLIGLQLTPWPGNIIKSISPETLGVYTKAFDKVPSSAALSLYPYATKIGLFKVLAYLGVFFLVINWADSKPKIQRLVHVFIGVGIFEAIYGIFAALGKSKTIWWFDNIRNTNFVTGTYINRNHFAGLMEIVIPLGFGVLIYLAGKQQRHREEHKASKIGGLREFLLSFDLSDSDRSKRGLLIFILAIMTLGVILSGSRGGIISLTISFIFMSSLLYTRKRFKRYAIIILIICSISLLYGMKAGLDKTLQRFDNNMIEENISRTRLMKTSLALWKEFPWLGTGWGTFQEVYKKHKTSEDEYLEIDHVHNDWLEVGLETGWLGFGLMVFSFLFCFVYFFILWKRRRNSFSIGMGLGGMGIMVSLAIHSFVDFNLHIPANALLLSIAIGLTYKALTCQREEKSGHIPHRNPKNHKQKKITLFFPRWARWPMAVILIGAFGYSLMLITKIYLAERFLPTLPNSTIEKGIPALRDIGTAINYERSNAKYYQFLASHLENIIHLSERGENNDNNSHKNIEDEETGTEKKVSRRDREDIQYVNSFIDKVRNEEADKNRILDNLIFKAWKRAIQLNPTNPDYHLRLGWHLMKLGKSTENVKRSQILLSASEKEFQRALYFMPNSAEIHFSLGCYWVWKSRVVREQETYFDSFDRFIYHFQEASQMNREYEQKIREMIQAYYPEQSLDHILDAIFVNTSDEI